VRVYVCVILLCVHVHMSIQVLARK
jgi:hypothetical protein